jgi:hypothetical protein
MALMMGGALLPPTYNHQKTYEEEEEDDDEIENEKSEVVEPVKPKKNAKLGLGIKHRLRGLVSTNHMQMSSNVRSFSFYKILFNSLIPISDRADIQPTTAR